MLSLYSDKIRLNCVLKAASTCNIRKGAPLVKLSDDINRKSKIEILIRILDFEGC